MNSESFPLIASAKHVNYNQNDDECTQNDDHIPLSSAKRTKRCTINDDVHGSLSESSSSINSGVFVEKNEPDLPPPSEKHTTVYTQRWYILFVFSFMNLMQNYLSNVWVVIAVSVDAAFSWTYADVSLMLNWYWAMYLLFIFPVAWCMESKGEETL